MSTVNTLKHSTEIGHGIQCTIKHIYNNMTWDIINIIMKLKGACK
jgi:hypothetical protein